MKSPKNHTLVVRVTDAMKKRLAAIADAKGEAESIVIREAILKHLDALEREHAAYPHSKPHRAHLNDR
jgi:predicted DNA-binding protein